MREIKQYSDQSPAEGSVATLMCVHSMPYFCASLEFVCRASVSFSLQPTGKHLERKTALNMNLCFYKFSSKQDAPRLSAVFLQIFGVMFWGSLVHELEYYSTQCISLNKA